MEYQPIPCSEHERLELAVLRRSPLRLQLNDGRRLTGCALDVYTEPGAEWLKLRTSAGEEIIRLDQIGKIELVSAA
jgi:transcriptional antiterminator Rof (Rho-off)